jgi:hypothetical protein
MKTPMKVDFEDTMENWRLWGELIELWIYYPDRQPDDTDGLINQMEAHGITKPGVYGSSRKVKFVSYGEDDPLVIELPAKEMLEKAQNATKPCETYPLPIFYDEVYDCERKKLTAEVIKKIAACRIGEYTINECM